MVYLIEAINLHIYKKELDKALDKQAWGIAHDILTGITAVQDLES